MYGHRDVYQHLYSMHLVWSRAEVAASRATMLRHLASSMRAG